MDGADRADVTVGVYAVKCETTGNVKVGYTRDLRKRLAGLQNGSPTVLRLLAWHPGLDLKAERALHLVMADEKLHGEWFRESTATQQVVKWLKGGALDVPSFLKSSPFAISKPTRTYLRRALKELLKK